MNRNTISISQWLWYLGGCEVFGRGGCLYNTYTKRKIRSFFRLRTAVCPESESFGLNVRFRWEVFIIEILIVILVIVRPEQLYLEGAIVVVRSEQPYLEKMHAFTEGTNPPEEFPPL